MASLTTQQLTRTFDLLTHPYRRYALYYLTTEPEPVSIEALAREIRRWDRSNTETHAHTTNVEAALRHVHLPKLTDAGAIAVNTATEQITLRETHAVERFLDEVVEIDGFELPATTY